MKNEEEPVDLFILFYTHTALVCDIFPTLPLQSENKLNTRKNRQSQIQPLKFSVFLVFFTSLYPILKCCMKFGNFTLCRAYGQCNRLLQRDDHQGLPSMHDLPCSYF